MSFNREHVVNKANVCIPNGEVEGNTWTLAGMIHKAYRGLEFLDVRIGVEVLCKIYKADCQGIYNQLGGEKPHAREQLPEKNERWYLITKNVHLMLRTEFY